MSRESEEWQKANEDDRCDLLHAAGVDANRHLNYSRLHWGLLPVEVRRKLKGEAEAAASIPPEKLPDTDFNPYCPFCDKLELRGVVEVTYTNVPLHSDGYDPTEGDVRDPEPKQIECAGCGKAVPVEHYSHTKGNGKPCKCKVECDGP